MVGAYTSLPPAVAATVPRRTVFRDSWIRHQPSASSEASDVGDTTSAASSPASTPPMTPRSPRPSKLGELRQKWDSPRPMSVVLTTYSPPGDKEKQELQGITGRVSKAKAFFESVPLQSPEKEASSSFIGPRENEPSTAAAADTIVSYRVRNPLRDSPKPKPRRLRNTISTFPRWVSEDDSVSKEDSSNSSDTHQMAVISDVSSSTSEGVPQGKMEVDPPPVEITRIKPSFIRRRYGTVTGLITDRSNIEEALRNRLSAERTVYSKMTSEGSVHTGSLEDTGAGDHVASAAAAAAAAGVIFQVGGKSSLSSSSSLISIGEGENEIHQTQRVAVVSVADGKNTATATARDWEAEDSGERQPAAALTTTVSRVCDGAWNRRRVAAPSHNPLPSCRCDHATSSLDDPHITRISNCSSSSSECQGSAAEGHVPSSPTSSSKETMIVLPEDGQVQAAPAPRVVAACIKSYHDIPEELFNTLQESSVDPQPSPSPPPPPPPSSPPTPVRNNNVIIYHAAPSPPTPAPRSDWKTMREGRKALLMGEVSDADTEEGSEADLGGVASTSDYHTSDGRGSSLSGASDDHHRHDNSNHQHQHQKIEFGFYNDNQDEYHSNTKDVDEEAEFELYNPQDSTPAVFIRNNFRGFCSTMLGSQPMPSSTEYVLPPSRPPPPTRFSTRSRSPTPSRSDQRPSSSASLLEEELRAAGVYFRRPGSPPRIPARSRTLSPPPRPPSSLKLERNSIREAEAVAAALHVLDASLAGLSDDSSGESSPARSHSSTVVELRQQQQQQYGLDPAAVDTQHSPRSSSSSSSVVFHPTSALTVEATTTTTTTCAYSPSSQPDLCDTSDSASLPRSALLYNSDLNDSDNSSAVDYNTYEPGLNNSCAGTPDDRTSFSGVEGVAHCYGASLKRPGSGGIVRGGLGRASSTVGVTGEDGGSCESPHHHQHHHQSHHYQQPKDPSAMENFNLIEEVYVDTRPVPRSTVSMRAYYPGVHYDSPSSSPTPKSCLKPPQASSSTSSNSSSSRHPERGASLDSTQTVPADSDSGHESGATSPCGTLILDDTQSPPPSPPNNHTLKTQSTSIHTHAPSLSHSRTSSLHSCRGPGVLEGEVGVAVVGDPTHIDIGMGRMALDPRPPTHFVVVAIDFGTTYSGYAFSFTRDPDSIHMMKKWEGGDPGVQNQKTPTIVLLTPEEEFHSLGFIARDTYHDLDPKDAKKWLYFDKFKMALHADQTLSRDTLLEAANGRRIPALKIFSYALQYFRDHALKELSDQAGVEVLEEDVRWVITVPAIWSHPAKQFMRTAAYQAGMGSSARPEQLLIALEPEAAAIYCRRLRRHQLLPERPPELRPPRHSTLKEATPPPPDSTSVPALPELDREELVSLPYRSVETVADWLTGDTVYAVVDCGGGTVDITVHQMTDKSTGHLKELHKATGGPHGSTGVDEEFERLLETIFGADFLQTFRQQRPAAYVDLMIAFESRKRNASPYRSNPLNIALPFSFIDLYRKFRGKDVEWAMKKHQNLGVKWSAQGMLRVEQETMRQLFLPTLTSITQAIEAVLSAPEVGHLQYMFLVGGFAESELLQKHIRDIFGHRVNVIIPQGMGLAILRGAVQFGLDPGVVTVRRSRLTYGVGVLNRYQPGLHPSDKRVVAAGSEWCADVLDRFVAVDESVAVGDVVVRPYTPATPGQSTVILHLYATHRHDAKFVTEDGVQRVGTLHLELGAPIQNSSGSPRSGRREITVHMKFGDTEVKASAVDHLTGQVVRANIDFLAL